MARLVSVVCTLHNYAHYIEDLIKSVLRQTHSNWELIIVDDASTDNPKSVIQKYNDNRIRLIQFPVNYGYAKAKNEGIIASKGEFIVMIDADDMLTDKSIALRYGPLSAHPSALWCHGDVYDLEDGGIISKRGAGKRATLRKELTKVHKMDLKRQYHHRLIHAQSVMIKKDFHRKFGLYDESLRFSADNEMFRRAIRFGAIPIYCPAYVAFYRRHNKQMSGSQEKHKLKDEVKKRIIETVEVRYKEGINASNTRLLEN